MCIHSSSLSFCLGTLDEEGRGEGEEVERGMFADR